MGRTARGSDDYLPSGGGAGISGTFCRRDFRRPEGVAERWGRSVSSIEKTDRTEDAGGNERAAVCWH